MLRLSDVQPFPEGIEPEAFDLEPDWKGVYLGHVQVFNLNSLVEWLPSKIDIEKWFIGRGGVTGKATAVFDLHPDMTSKNFAVRALRVAFRQNTLHEGLVQLAVKLVYYHDTVVYLDLANQANGIGGYTNPITGTSDFGPYPSNMDVRNGFRAPGIWNVDAIFSKRFAVGAAKGVQVRVEVYNLFNHAQFVPGAISDVGRVSTSGATAYTSVTNVNFNNPEKPALRATLEIVTHEGTAEEHKETKVVALSAHPETVKVTLKGGRRKTPLPYIPPTVIKVPPRRKATAPAAAGAPRPGAAPIPIR